MSGTSRGPGQGARITAMLEALERITDVVGRMVQHNQGNDNRGGRAERNGRNTVEQFMNLDPPVFKGIGDPAGS